MTKEQHPNDIAYSNGYKQGVFDTEMKYKTTLTTKDQEKEEAVRAERERTEEYLRQLVHTLHEEFCFTGLATEEQWNEAVSPKLKALANVIRGYAPDSPTARVYKFPALPIEDNN